MSQELTIQNDDGFDVQERAGNFIIGGMIKYFNHVYTLNKTEPLPPDLTLLVISITTCWVRWWDHAPTEHRVTRSGQLHPQREDLPDQDKTLWQPGLGGNPADPWKDTRYMHLINLQTGQDYTFVTDASGGRMAIGELKSSIRNVRVAHLGAMPIIRFRTGTFKSKQFGLVPRPICEIVDWHRGLKEVPAQISDQSKAPTTSEQLDTFAKSAPPMKTLTEEMGDEIPNFDDPVPSQQNAPPPKTSTVAPNVRPNARRELKKSPAKAGAKPAGRKPSNLDAG
jgi:hypothetical protein